MSDLNFDLLLQEMNSVGVPPSSRVLAKMIFDKEQKGGHYRVPPTCEDAQGLLDKGIIVFKDGNVPTFSTYARHVMENKLPAAATPLKVKTIVPKNGKLKKKKRDLIYHNGKHRH